MRNLLLYHSRSLCVRLPLYSSLLFFSLLLPTGPLTTAAAAAAVCVCVWVWVCVCLFVGGVMFSIFFYLSHVNRYKDSRT